MKETIEGHASNRNVERREFINEIHIKIVTSQFSIMNFAKTIKIECNVEYIYRGNAVSRLDVLLVANAIGLPLAAVSIDLKFIDI